VTTTLVEGDAVTRGDVIGTVLPGHCATVCVHLGVRVDGQYVSPLRFLGGIPRAILLPTR
jgi:murein DD-endopeptidase MepM/ murein hydrolase activator NlpD